MKGIVVSLCLLFLSTALLPVTEAVPLPEWGFFAHRRINRLAVFTLPPELIAFYKKHLEYVTEHAVDPDKRRYATRHEAPRHYIDLDHWGAYPFPAVPRDWDDALLRFTELAVVGEEGDTTVWFDRQRISCIKGDSLVFSDSTGGQRWTGAITIGEYRRFFRRRLLPQYYEESWHLPCDSLAALAGQAIDCREVLIRDPFSEHGILPYHLLRMQHRLTDAFRRKDGPAVLRLSAEMGHYLSDAHVPLHTTENYNGQLTGQEGIHAFWESRIPELFADDEYDFFVGKARYIRHPRDYFWDVVLESHRRVEAVLTAESTLRATFPADRQYCYEQRQQLTVHTQCAEYAQAYQRRLGGMVEARMRAAVLAVGSSWYTAWVDAGQPDLNALLPPAEAERPEALPEGAADHYRPEKKQAQ